VEADVVGMKATMSKDGQERVNLRVEFRLDSTQVASLLAIYALTYGGDGEELSEKKLLEMVKSQLTYQGLDVLEFGANVDVDDDTLEWSKEQVAKYWKG
jgi:hypothetical protein